MKSKQSNKNLDIYLAVKWFRLKAVGINALCF